MWLARDRDKRIYAYHHKRLKKTDSIFTKAAFVENVGGQWVFSPNTYDNNKKSFDNTYARIKDEAYPEVRWEDSEPTWKRFIPSELFYCNPDIEMDDCESTEG